MRFSRALISAGTAVCVVAGISLTTVTPAEAVVGATADYEMNEPAGSTVMTDSSGNGLNGVIDPTGVQTGAVFDGATGYNWVRRPPEQAPPSPERVIQVPDNINLEPGNQPFTIELRYRTQENFGNIIQKGQAQTPGGQWKIQNPGGIPSCLFKGSLGQVATGAKTPLNDDQWHNLTCVLQLVGRHDVRGRSLPEPEERLGRHGRQQLPDDVRRQARLRPDRHHLRLLLRPDRLRQVHQGRQSDPDR